MQEYNSEKEIGQRIRELRDSYGYTQQQMAEMLNLTTEHFRSVESGRRGVTADTLKKVKRIFNVSADYLLDGTDGGNDISMLEAMLKGVDSSVYSDVVKAVVFVIELSNRNRAELQKNNDCTDVVS